MEDRWKGVMLVLCAWLNASHGPSLSTSSLPSTPLVPAGPMLPPDGRWPSRHRHLVDHGLPSPHRLDASASALAKMHP